MGRRVPRKEPAQAAIGAAIPLESLPSAFVTIGLGLIPLWMAALVVAALSSERHNKQIIALARRASQLPAC